jgi:hypothetical protein
MEMEEKIQPTEVLANPHISKEEFAKTILASPEWQRLTKFAIDIMYNSLHSQPVVNVSHGQLVTGLIRIYGDDKQTDVFRFGILTEDGHVKPQ